LQKANNGKGELTTLARLETYLAIQSLTVCFKLWHRIEIGACRLIKKVLVVFETVGLFTSHKRCKVMEFTYFIGTDVSKNELDFAVMQGKVLLFHREVPNKQETIQAFVKELLRLPGFELEKAVFCMEHTGIYNNPLLTYLHKKKANVCLEAATQIKNSLGNIRGKNDKVDAMRIAEYAYRNREGLRLWQPKREVVQRLAHLSATRSRLLTAQKMLKTPLKESVGFVKKGLASQNMLICSRTLHSIEADLKKAENAIDEIVKNDPELSRLFGIITSVTGIGTLPLLVFFTNKHLAVEIV
jgi:transposase